jgi:hypothetical protein
MLDARLSVLPVSTTKPSESLPSRLITDVPVTAFVRSMNNLVFVDEST